MTKYQLINRPHKYIIFTSHRSLELDALCEGQLLAVVDGAGGPLHVLLPRVGPGLAPATRRLLAAERAADLRARGRDVHVHDAAVRTLRAHPLEQRKYYKRYLFYAFYI